MPSPTPSPPRSPDHVEVDTVPETTAGADDADSAYGDDGTSSASTSLRSSILRYEWKHGRRYHAYQAGKYSFPNDEREQERLDMVHHVYYRTMNDRLFLAPVDPDAALRVLDVGTGTGMWAIHLGDDYPGTEEIVGNDLSPIQPTWCPPNVRFIVDDVELDWAEPLPYDLIHCRYMAGAIKDWPRLVKQMYDNLKPGGWLELQESANTLYSQDGSLAKNDPLMKLMDGLMQACEKIGRTMDPAPSMEQWVKDAGFVNVKVEVFKMPVGAWPRDPRLKEIGTLLGVNFTEGVEAFTAALFADVLGWSKDEVTVLNAGVRDSIRRGEAHALFDFMVITGQRPE